MRQVGQCNVVHAYDKAVTNQNIANPVKVASTNWERQDEEEIAMRCRISERQVRDDSKKSPENSLQLGSTPCGRLTSLLS